MNETLELLKRTLREMWRRRWVGLVAAWIVGLLAIAIVYRIPERYEASARLFVDTESLLKPLLAGLAVQPNVDQQVALISRTLISRPNVEKVVRMSDLDLRAKSDAEREQLVEEAMAKVKLIGSSSTNLYTITFQDPDPEQARKVVQSLLTIFVESSLGDKRQDSRAAVRFLDDQIKNYERALQSAENRLKEFKLKYLGIAERDGSGGGDYFSRLGALQSQIEAARLELRAAEQARDAYKQELAGEKPTFLDTPSPQVAVPAGVDTAPGIDERLTQLKVGLDGLTRRFTENHPDVINTRRIIAELEDQRRAALAEKQRAAAATSAASVAKPVERNPVFQQLRVSLVEAEAQVAAARAKLSGLEGQYAQLKSRAAMVPQVEAEYAQLNRDYEVQRRTYETLLTRRESATMGIGVQDTGGAQFRVIDPPRVSPRPVFPNRLALLGVATLASLAAGILGAFLASQISPTFLDNSTLRRGTSRPVLGSVSMLPSPARVIARRRRNWFFAGGLSSLLAVFAAAVAYALLLWRTAI
jgi:polysaccharide chain length determinant protein (PEP-CTERM system associated)